MYSYLVNIMNKSVDMDIQGAINLNIMTNESMSELQSAIWDGLAQVPGVILEVLSSIGGSFYDEFGLLWTVLVILGLIVALPIWLMCQK